MAERSALLRVSGWLDWSLLIDWLVFWI